jgi:hypothetical protein
MKVAVIMGGVTRDYWNHVDAFKRMMGDIDYDTFIYTWDLFEKTEHKNNHLKASEDICNAYKCENPGTSLRYTLANWFTFENALKPRVDYYKSFPIPFPKTNLLTGIFAQHFTIKQAFNMISNPNDYNLIIRYRFDWHPKFQLDWNGFGPVIFQENCLMFSNQKVHGIKGTKWSMNDLFAVSTPENMKIYCGLYDEMMKGTYDKYILENKNIITEYLLVLHLRLNNVNLKMANWPYKKFYATASKKGKR